MHPVVGAHIRNLDLRRISVALTIIKHYTGSGENLGVLGRINIGGLILIRGLISLAFSVGLACTFSVGLILDLGVGLGVVGLLVEVPLNLSALHNMAFELDAVVELLIDVGVLLSLGVSVDNLSGFVRLISKVLEERIKLRSTRIVIRKVRSGVLTVRILYRLLNSAITLVGTVVLAVDILTVINILSRRSQREYPVVLTNIHRVGFRRLYGHLAVLLSRGSFLSGNQHSTMSRVGELGHQSVFVLLGVRCGVIRGNTRGGVIGGLILVLAGLKLTLVQLPRHHGAFLDRTTDGDSILQGLLSATLSLRLRLSFDDSEGLTGVTSLASLDYLVIGVIPDDIDPVVVAQFSLGAIPLSGVSINLTLTECDRVLLAGHALSNLIRSTITIQYGNQSILGSILTSILLVQTPCGAKLTVSELRSILLVVKAVATGLELTLSVSADGAIVGDVIQTRMVGELSALHVLSGRIRDGVNGTEAFRRFVLVSTVEHLLIVRQSHNLRPVVVLGIRNHQLGAVQILLIGISVELLATFVGQIPNLNRLSGSSRSSSRVGALLHEVEHHIGITVEPTFDAQGILNLLTLTSPAIGGSGQTDCVEPFSNNITVGVHVLAIRREEHLSIITIRICLIDIASQMMRSILRLGEVIGPVVITWRIQRIFLRLVRGLTGLQNMNRSGEYPAVALIVGVGVLISNLVVGIILAPQFILNAVARKHVTFNLQVVLDGLALGHIDVMFVTNGLIVIRISLGNISRELDNLELLGFRLLAIKHQPTVGIPVTVALLLVIGLLPVIAGVVTLSSGATSCLHPSLGNDTGGQIHGSVAAGAKTSAVLMRLLRRVELQAELIGTNTRIVHLDTTEGYTIKVRTDGLARNILTASGRNLRSRSSTLSIRVLAIGKTPDLDFILRLRRNVAPELDIISNLTLLRSHPKVFRSTGLHLEDIESLIFGKAIRSLMIGETVIRIGTEASILSTISNVVTRSGTVPHDITTTIIRISTNTRGGSRRNGNLHTEVVLGRVIAIVESDGLRLDVLATIQIILTTLKVIISLVIRHFSKLRQVVGGQRLDLLVSPDTITVPNLEGVLSTINGLTGKALDIIIVRLLITSLVKDVIDLKGLSTLRVLAVILAIGVFSIVNRQPLLRDGGGVLLNVSTLEGLVTNLVLVAFLAILMGIEDTSSRGIQSGLPPVLTSVSSHEARISGLEGVIPRAGIILAILDGLELRGVNREVLGSHQIALLAIAFVIARLTIQLNGHVRTSRHMTEAISVTGAVALMVLTISALSRRSLVVNCNLIIQLLANRTHGLGVRSYDTTWGNHSGLSGNTHIVGSQQSTILSLQLGLPIDVAGVLGGNILRTNRSGLLIIGKSTLKGDLLTVKKLGGLIVNLVNATLDRSVSGELNVPIFAQHTRVASLNLSSIVELFSRLSTLAVRGFLSSDFRSLNDNGLGGNTHLVGCQNNALSVLQLCTIVDITCGLGRSLLGGNLDFLTLTAVLHIIVGNLIPIGVENLSVRLIPSTRLRLVGSEVHVPTLRQDTLEHSRIVELLIRLNLTLTHCSGNGRRANQSILTGDTQIMLGQLVSVLVVQGCVPVHSTSILSGDFLGLNTHGLTVGGSLGLLSGDSDLVISQQLTSISIRLSRHWVIRVEQHVSTWLNITTNSGNIGELLINRHVLFGNLGRQ